MAKKPDISTIASGYYSRQALNTNFENIQDKFDNTLSIDGSTPNAMGADIDLNSNDLLNASTINTSSLYLDGNLLTTSSAAAAPNANAVSYNQGGTGAIDRTAQVKLQESISVKDFGATGNGTTDDTAAIQAAANTGKAIIIPEGIYVISATINFTQASAIRGEGMSASFLKFSGAYGIKFTNQAGDNNPVEISNLTMLQTGSAVGVAIWVDNSAQSGSGVIQNRTSPRMVINNVSVKGSGTVANSGWSRGVYANDVLHATISGFHFEGKHGASQADIETLSAIHFFGSGSPVEIVIDNSWVFYVQKAIEITNCEGLFVSDCNLVAVNYGVYFDAAGTEPQLNLIDNHINANIACTVAQHLAQGMIAQNLFYARGTAPGNVAGVTLTDCIWTSITNNTFVKITSNDLNAIVIGEDGEGVLIDSNIFQSSTTAIWLQSNSSRVRVNKNVFGNVTSNKILNQGTLNRIFGNQTTVKRTGTLALANATLTAIPFQAIHVGNTEFWSSSNATRLTAPVTGKYKISGLIVFANTANGLRRVAIRRNGSSVIGFPTLSCSASSTARNDALFAGEATVDLTAGQYIELFAEQATGSSMTLPIAETSLKLEYVWE